MTFDPSKKITIGIEIILQINIIAARPFNNGSF
jgi:hypothetical protein